MAPKAFTCNICQKDFKRKSDLQRHQRTVHGGDGLTCQQCVTSFSRADNYLRHKRRHQTDSLGTSIQSGGAKVDRNIIEDTNDPTETENSDCITSEEAIGGNLKRIFLEATNNAKYDPMSFLKLNEEIIRSILKEALVKRRGIKFYLTLQVRFTKEKADQNEVTEPHFHGRCHIVLIKEDINSALMESIKKIYTAFIEFQREGSNWSLDKILGVNVNVVNYQPIKGSSFLPLPAKLARKKAIVNVQNTDEKCFMWSILAALYPVIRDPQRVTKYTDHADKLDLTGISFPVKVADISKFEKQNHLSINVFGYENGEIYPLHLTKERDVRHVDLLILKRGDKSHYCWIKNFNRLMGDQHSHKTEYHYCQYCLHGFTKKKLLEKHLPYCQVHGAQRTEMPSEDDKWLKYKDISKQLRVPFVVYADFECILEQIHGCQPDPERSSTIKLAKHAPSGFTYKVVGISGDLTENHVTYRGSDAADVFVQHMVQLEDRIHDIIRHPKPMVLSDKECGLFRTATHYCICNMHLGGDSVRDHCHITGKFRGAAHNSCNINFRLTERIPVLFHNLRGYDAHIIMQAIGKMKQKRINCIPQNHEKYISFSLGKLDFIDSFQFLPTSLEKLVNNLAASDMTMFKHLQSYIRDAHPGSEESKLELLSRKGVYPYRYMDSFQRFNETQLPAQPAFYNDLYGEDVSDQDYAHAQRVWGVLNIGNLGQYHDLYMETDVHLLADVFENFRNLCIEIYGLDPAHFYTSPGLAWQAALKMTGVELELFTDPDMHLFVEKGLRGGISTITKRHAKANNTYLDECDTDQASTYIIYLDANNLYGWAMSQSLPTHDFEWLTAEELLNFDVSPIPDNGDEGYILEVDLEYPHHLHDYHNDYPLAPESFEIQPEMLSPYQQALLTDLGMKTTCCSKLVPNLYEKKNYVVHYRNLQMYLSMGLIVTKIHRVLKFRQSPWLKAYIDFNTSKRKEANNEFEKDFFKLMNNSVFGKTMENLRKRVDIQLVHHEKRLLKLTKKPGFKSFKIFNDDLASIELHKQKLVLNRPIYVGFSVLDLSKTLMYDFHYNYVKSKYGSRAQLLFTDTDSLCYEITTDDLYHDLKDDKDLFDLSAYPRNHPLYDATNKKIIGKMKDETESVPVKEFVGLRSKMYSMVHGNTEKRTAKGISKAVIRSKLRHDLYKQCLFNRETQMEPMILFRTDRHEINTVKMNKTTLSAYDDKRYILEDGIQTLAHGHWRCQKL